MIYSHLCIMQYRSLQLIVVLHQKNCAEILTQNYLEEKLVSCFMARKSRWDLPHHINSIKMSLLSICSLLWKELVNFATCFLANILERQQHHTNFCIMKRWTIGCCFLSSTPHASSNTHQAVKRLISGEITHWNVLWRANTQIVTLYYFNHPSAKHFLFSATYKQTWYISPIRLIIWRDLWQYFCDEFHDRSWHASYASKSSAF